MKNIKRFVYNLRVYDYIDMLNIIAVSSMICRLILSKYEIQPNFF